MRFLFLSAECFFTKRTSVNYFTFLSTFLFHCNNSICEKRFTPFLQVNDIESTSKRWRSQKWIYKMAVHDYSHMGRKRTWTLETTNYTSRRQEQRHGHWNLFRMDLDSTWYQDPSIWQSSQRRGKSQETVQGQKTACQSKGLKSGQGY